MVDQPDQLNIPAYLRKRSISAKARRQPTIPKLRKTSIKKRRLRQPTIEELTISEPSIEEIFPNPIEDLARPTERKVREMQICGICEGYLDKIDVAIIKLTSSLREGDKIIFEKQDGLFEQEVKSMQINRKEVRLARTGSDIGMKVAMQPKVGTQVYKVI